jgi:hypothetical protein
MRKLLFLITVLLSPTVLAAAVDIVGTFWTGQTIDLSDTPLECSDIEIERSSVKVKLLDCTKSPLDAVRGAIYLQDEEDPDKKGHDVYSCVSGCNGEVVQTIRYSPLESGC